MPPVPAPAQSSSATPQHAMINDQASQEPGDGEGQFLTRNPDSPSGQFGIPMQMQQAPKVIQRVPSKEVPDLEKDVVDKVNAALKAGQQQKALDLILAALIAKDPAAFDSKFLVGGRLHTKGGGNSLTETGPKFKKWLTDKLEKGPKKAEDDEAACRKYMDTLSVPKDLPDIKISIANSRFKNVSILYSVIRHEFIHYQQVRKNPLKHLSTSEWPAGFANPSENGSLKVMEVEAYLWEAENLTKTGAIKKPQFVWNVYKMLNSSMSGAFSKEVKPFKKRWNAALANLFKISLDGFLKEVETLIAKVGPGPVNKATYTKIEAAIVYVDDLWGYKQHYPAETKTLKKRYEKIKTFEKGVESAHNTSKFPAALTEAENKLKNAKDAYDGYNVWNPLYQDWIALDAKAQKQFEVRYTKIIVPAWTAAFEMINKRMVKLYDKDKDDSRLNRLANVMFRVLQGSTKSKIDAKTKAAKQDILDKWKKKLGLY